MINSETYEGLRRLPVSNILCLMDARQTRLLPA
jgi:hypothetical protein